MVHVKAHSILPELGEEIVPWKRVLAACAAAGVLAGVVAGQVRLGLGWPGHKVLFWLVPVLLARLAMRSPAGATAGALAAGFTASAVGGNMAGAAVHLPVVGAAGVVLDVAAGLVERRGLSAVWAVPMLGLAGMVANLVMLGKRLMAPLVHTHHLGGMPDLAVRLLAYAAAGMVGGLAAAGLAYAVRRVRRRPVS
jgi:hypothetical protein